MDSERPSPASLCAIFAVHGPGAPLDLLEVDRPPGRRYDLVLGPVLEEDERAAATPLHTQAVVPSRLAPFGVLRQRGGHRAGAPGRGHPLKAHQGPGASAGPHPAVRPHD